MIWVKFLVLDLIFLHGYTFVSSSKSIMTFGKKGRARREKKKCWRFSLQAFHETYWKSGCKIVFACPTVVYRVIRSDLFPNTAEKELGQLRKVIRRVLGIIILRKGKKKPTNPKQAVPCSSKLQHCTEVRLCIHFTRRPLHLQDFFLLEWDKQTSLTGPACRQRLISLCGLDWFGFLTPQGRF